MRYNARALPKPFFIEFNGTPSSGKTTTIKQIYNFLKRHGFKVLMPQEGAEVVPHTERGTPAYNIRTGIYALEIFLRLREGHEYDFVLFDRCVFDAYTWMIYWSEKGKLSEKEKALYQNFFSLSPLWVCDIDRVYCLICDAKTSLERENAISLSRKLGETTNPETVERF